MSRLRLMIDIVLIFTAFVYARCTLYYILMSSTIDFVLPAPMPRPQPRLGRPVWVMYRTNVRTCLVGYCEGCEMARMPGLACKQVPPSGVFVGIHVFRLLGCLTNE